MTNEQARRLFEPHLPRLRRDARYLCGWTDDADEVVQRTLVRAWEVLEREPRYALVDLSSWLRVMLEIQAHLLWKEKRAEAAAAREYAVVVDLDLVFEERRAAAVRAREALLAEARRRVREAALCGAPLNLTTRDCGRGQPVERPRTLSCKNGHRRTPENTRYAADGTVRCLDCAYASKRARAAST